MVMRPKKVIKGNGKDFKLSEKSYERLSGCHPDLIKLCERALQLSKYDFGITEGLRTLTRQKDLIAKGKSWTLESKHLKQSDGYSHAFDFVVVDESGNYTYKAGYYRKVMQAFVTAAIELNIQIEFGGLWKTTFDGPHVQLNQKYI